MACLPKKLSVAVLLSSVCLCQTGFAAQVDDRTTIVAPVQQTNTDNAKLITAYERLIKQHEKHNLNIVRSVRVLINHYPEHVIEILHAAFNQEPQHYRYIIRAAIHSEPALTQDIVITAIARQVDSPANIVSIAIDAEPSYIDDIVRAASYSAPSDIDEIVKTAVKSDPSMTQQVLISASDDGDGYLNKIVSKTLNALPALGNYLMDTMRSVIPYMESKLTPEEEIALRREKTKEILRGALQAGIAKSEVESAAKAAGLNTQDLDQIASEVMYAPPN